MIEENDESLGSAGNESLMDEDTSEHRTEDTTGAVGGEHVEGIVDARLTAPVHCTVADNGDDERDEDALANCHISSGRSDGNKTDNATYGSTHCRGFATTQTVEEYPCHHRRG